MFYFDCQKIKGGLLQWNVNITSDNLKNRGLSKVNISDNNLEYSTSRIVYSTRSNMNFCHIQEYGTYL